MANKYLVTFKQAVIKPDGSQVLAVYGTIAKTKDGLIIAGRLHILKADVYAAVEYEGEVNPELVWVL